MNAPTRLLTDRALSQRLELAEAAANVAFIKTRQKTAPQRRADWIEVDGAYAMFDGVDSPLTQTFGLGIQQDATPATLDALEAFFQARHANVDHEVSPLANSELLTLLPSRGYHPIELSSILFLESKQVQLPSPASDISVRLLAGKGDATSGDGKNQDGTEEMSMWSRISAQGWAAEQPMFLEFIQDLGSVFANKEKPLCWLAEWQGACAGTASMHIHEGVAILAGASTLPEYRRRGIQYALLLARLQFALEQGCDLLMMAALPGSPSQRNAERHGFRIAYTRIKWRLSMANEPR